MILAITSYIPIPDHPRPTDDYEELGSRLFETGIPLLRLDGSLEHCWLWQWLHRGPQGFTWSVADNPKKNSLAYHCVQAQKSELLAIAADMDGIAVPDVLVWIDYGIFHVPGVTAQIVRDFIQRAENERAIAIPGCWDRNYEYRDDWPCWRFCGGVIVMPRVYAGVFDAVMKDEYKRWIRKTNNVSWEVNTLSRVEKRYPDLPLWHYRADHNASMFTAYKRGENADGQ